MTTKNKLWVVAGALTVVLALTAVFSGVLGNVEQPKYAIVERDGDLEIRDYAPMIVAETNVTGTREAAIREGFRTIADYIFGNNLGSRKIAMTAPVIQQGDGHDWQIRFVIPASYTMETLPKPKNTAVSLKEVQGRRFAVIRFSGTAHHKNLRRYVAKLQALIKSKNLNEEGGPIYAFYNPPWTLPFLRRNEVLIAISS